MHMDVLLRIVGIALIPGLLMLAARPNANVPAVGVALLVVVWLLVWDLRRSSK